MTSKLKDKEIQLRAKKRLAKDTSIAEEIFPELGKGKDKLAFIKDNLQFTRLIVKTIFNE